jgi:hypothetical protein
MPSLGVDAAGLAARLWDGADGLPARLVPGLAPGVLPSTTRFFLFFLGFFRDDSLPLASERLGEPGRFLLLDVPKGVFVSLVGTLKVGA